MMFSFSEEEMRYLVSPKMGPYICYESKTPPGILKSLKRLAKQYFDMVGADIIVFKK